MCKVGPLYASANIKESSKDVGKSWFRMHRINVWRKKKTMNVCLGDGKRKIAQTRHPHHHDLTAVGEAKISDPIIP